MTGNNIPENSRKKAVIMAVGGGIFAGAATMFIPTSILEMLTGTTGLSEIIPATAAPLGDKARALIAFGTGALSMALLFILLLRKQQPAASEGVGNGQAEVPAGNAPRTDDGEGGLADRIANLKNRIPQIALPKMPWAKGEGEVRELGDLPSLRSADAHPDAPARRPLLATRDIPVAADAPMTMSAQPSGGISPQHSAPVAAPEAPAMPEPAATAETPAMQDKTPAAAMPVFDQAVEAAESAEPSAAPQAAALPEATDASQAAMDATNGQPSIDNLIGQLQAAVALRKQQLTELRLLAERASREAEPEPALPPATSNQGAAQQAAPLHEEQPSRPPLEAVPPAPENNEEREMDQALNAALETLQRMNAQAR